MGIQKYKKQKVPDRSGQQKLVNRAKYERFTVLIIFSDSGPIEQTKPI